MKLAHLDYRNGPADYVRGQLNIRGARAVMNGHPADVAWVQPVAAKWNSKPVLNFEFDRSVWEIARMGRETLPLPISGSDISGAYVLDFSKPVVVDQFIELLRRVNVWRFLFDYGTWDLAWEASLGEIDDDKWMAWGFGWSRVKEAFVDSWVQTNKPITSHPLFLEKVGWSLTPVERARCLMQARPGCIVRSKDLSVRDRSTVETMVDMYDGYLAKWWDE